MSIEHFEYDSAYILTKKREVYLNFLERLWKAVCVRLLIEMLEKLKDGEKIQFGTATVEDKGIVLEKFKLFGSNEKHFCPWIDLVISIELEHSSLQKKMTGSFG